MATAVLVVEDDHDTRDWLVSCAEQAVADACVTAVATVAAANTAVERESFDLAIVDLGLPDGSGLDVIEQLRRTDASVKILVATICDDDRNLFAALRLGARGYILKDQDRDHVTRYIGDMAGGEVALSGKVASRIVDYFNTRGRPTNDGLLAPREEDVLRSIAKGFNVAVTAEMLGLTSNTVKSYVKTIYSKLGVSSRAEATAEAIRRGLVEVD